MAWVSLLRAIETATGVRSLGDDIEDGQRSLKAIVAALEQASPGAAQQITAQRSSSALAGAATAVAGWGSVTGARQIAVAQVEKEFGLPAGKIRKGAGIESIARAADDEDECTLAMRACEAALRAAGTDIGAVDCIIATSETYLAFPSLGASLHARLLAEPQTVVLDVGGGCLGLLNSFAVAQGFIAAGRFREILVATGDLHSRLLAPGRVKGEFAALFGDGASAFVLRAADSGAAAAYRLGEVLLGCDPTAAAAIRISLTDAMSLELAFDAESLSRAAVTRLQETIEDLEMRSGVKRAAAAGFATHQPNPRLLALLARQLGVPKEKFPPVARRFGNLGSSTCGVALSLALEQAAGRADVERGPIFLAALGPGLLWGGAVLR